MGRKIMISAMLLISVFLFEHQAQAATANQMPSSMWIGDSLYTVSGTPTQLRKNEPADSLYVFTNLDGQRAIAKSLPANKNPKDDNWLIVNIEFTPAGLKVHDVNNDGKANFEITDWNAVKQHIGFGHLKVESSGPEYACGITRERK